MIYFKFIFVVLLALSSHQPSQANSPADKLDPRYVSQLRVELRNVARPEQCLLFWKGVSEKLQDVADYSLPESGADFELLADLSRMLKYHRAYHKLSEFVDECSAILKALPKDKVALHTASRSRSLELPTPAPAANQQELDQLKKEAQNLREELSKKEKLLKDLEAQTKLKMEKLNVALLAREQQLREANHAREQEVNKQKQLCREKEANLLQQFEEQKKQAEVREKELNQEMKGVSLKELDELRREMEEKSKSFEQKKLELQESLTKEKEHLAEEVEKLKVELQSKESKQSNEKAETKCSMEAEQKKFEQIRKELSEKVELLSKEVRSKERQLDQEKEKCSKKLSEALKQVDELKEEVNKSRSKQLKEKRQKEDKDRPEAVPDTWEDIIRLYQRVFYDNSRPLDPAQTQALLKLLEKVFRGYTGPEVKARYKHIDRFLTVGKLKKKRCTKSDWDKLNELIQKHTTNINTQQYLSFWFIQRQDYCNRFYPKMMY